MAKKSEIGNESCFVLPGGESVLEATLKSKKAHSDGRKSYRICADGKRVSSVVNFVPQFLVLTFELHIKLFVGYAIEYSTANPARVTTN